MDPKVSVIIPVYNTEKYLQACIDCLLDQTMKELEFIFVDDASSDGSVKLLRENEKRDPERIRVLESPENRRQGGARNIGIRAARGKYVIFCDSDDLVAPEMYERLYDAVTESGADAAFCDLASVPEDVTRDTMRSLAAKEEHGAWSRRLQEMSGHSLSDSEISELLVSPLGGTVTFLMKRKFLLEQDLFFPEQVRYEDNYWGSLLKASLTSVQFLDEVLYFYRRHEASTTRSRNNPGVYDRVTLENRLLEEFRRRGLYDRLFPAIEYLYTTRYAFMTYGFFIYTYDDPPKDMLRKVMGDLKEHFPEWRKNPYYLRETGKRERLLNELKYRFPLLYAKKGSL